MCRCLRFLARNATGAGPASDASDATAPKDETLAATAVEHDTATLTIANHSGNWYYKANAAPYTSCSSNAVSTTSTSLTSLAGNTSYTFKAYSNSGCSTELAAAAAFLTKPAKPSKPTVTAGAGSGNLTIASSLTGGSGTLTKWQYTTDDGTTWSDISATDNSLSYTVTGLTDGISYTFKVRARNATGTGLDSEASDSATPTSTTLKADNVTTTGARLTIGNYLSIPADTVIRTTATLTIANQTGSWYYKRSEPGNGDHPYGSCSAAVSGTSVNLTGLTAGTTYTFKAYSDSGCKTETASQSFTTAAPLPAPTVSPTELTLAEGGGTGRYTIVLEAQPTGDVSVTATSSDRTVATVSPGSLTFTVSNWSDPQTVTVTGVDDERVNDPLRTATVSHAVSGGGYDGVAVPSVAITLNDDDTTSKEEEAAKRVDEVVLPDVVQQVAGATVTAITNRMSTVASAAVGGIQPVNPTTPANPAGDAVSLLEAITTGAVEFLWSRQGAIRSGEFTLQQALAGRRFAMPLSALGPSSDHGAADALVVSTPAFWGSADYTSYGNLLDGVEFDGNIFLLALGMDMEPVADLIAGLAVAINSSDFDYVDTQPEGP